jgi:predicted nucleic acid-binding protein
VIAVDSSVVIAGFASWHEQHPAAAKVLAQRPRVVAHAALESYSVLTRLPPPHRALPSLVATFLAERFPEAPLTMPAERGHGLIARLARQQIAGGQVYDALIAAIAVEHGATLVSLDRRAAAVYEAVGATVQQLG